MKKFEYCIYFLSDNDSTHINSKTSYSKDKLNSIGKEGWELCAIHNVINGKEYIFKREC